MANQEELKAQLLDLLQNKVKGLRWQYDVGCKVRALRAMGSYGDALIESVAEEGNATQSDLNRAAQFADLYSAKDLAGLRDLSWDQMKALLPLDAAIRERIVEKFKKDKETWTVVRIRQEIKKEVGPRRATRRPAQHPTLGFANDADELLRQTSAWIEYVGDVWADQYQEIVAQDEDEARTLEELESALKQAQAYVGDLRARLRSYKRQKP